MNDHLTDPEIERFVRGELTAAEEKRVVRHLLQGCEACEERLRPYLDLALQPEKVAVPADEPPLPPLLDEDAYEGDAYEGDAYDEAIARAMGSVLDRLPGIRHERQRIERGRALLRASGGLAGLSDEEAESLRGGPLVEGLLELSFEERYRDPEEMLQLALLARTAAENLDPAVYGPALVADFQARAWAELGNAWRVADELDEAAAALDEAERLLRRGTGDLYLLARVADLRASLCCDRRELAEACELLDAVHRLYRELGDDHLAGRALVSRGIYTNRRGEPREALGFLRAGLALLEPGRDAPLAAAALQSLLWVLVDCGECREAGALLLESGLRQALANEPLSLIKVRWLEGRIFAGTGRPGRAERAFEEARAGFLAARQDYHAALVGLDLAEVWLEQRKAPQVRELAGGMLATFRTLGIHREAVRALEHLHRACRQERVTPATIRHVSRFLARLEHEPRLRFRPGSR